MIHKISINKILFELNAPKILARLNPWNINKCIAKWWTKLSAYVIYLFLFKYMYVYEINN